MYNMMHPGIETWRKMHGGKLGRKTEAQVILFCFDVVSLQSRY